MGWNTVFMVAVFWAIGFAISAEWLRDKNLKFMDAVRLEFQLHLMMGAIIGFVIMMFAMATTDLGGSSGGTDYYRADRSR